MKTYMEKEILSQSGVLREIIEKYLKNGKIQLKKIAFKEIKFIASGSSYNAARLGEKFFEIYTNKRFGFEYASEFISKPDRKINNDTLYCFVSQSGETFDTKCALEIVKKEGGKTLAIVNNSNSSIYNTADFKIDMIAGVENSIAATKSFLSGVICLWLFALLYAKEKIDPEKQLEEAVLITEDVLENQCGIKSVSKILSKTDRLSLIGYNCGYILAKEGALKIKETSYIDTAAYPTGEFLHGHTAILNKNKTLIEIFTQSLSDFEKNTLEKIKKDFNPQIIAITDILGIKNSVLFPKCKYEISKICAITVLLQLIALNVALNLNMDVDKPLGLNKVVSG